MRWEQIDFKAKILQIIGRKNRFKVAKVVRYLFNYAIENDWLIKNPFAKKKGVISKAAEVERDRTLTFAEEAHKRVMTSLAASD